MRWNLNKLYKNMNGFEDRTLDSINKELDLANDSIPDEYKENYQIVFKIINFETLWDNECPHFYVEHNSGFLGTWEPIKSEAFDSIKWTNNAMSSYKHTLRDYLNLNPKRSLFSGLCLDYI